MQPITLVSLDTLSVGELEQLINETETEKQRLRQIQREIQAELTHRAMVPRTMSIDDGAMGQPSLVRS